MTIGTNGKWWTKMWRLTVGCQEVGRGCWKCYAASISRRFPSLSAPFDDVVDNAGWTGKIHKLVGRLDDPNEWPDGQTVFICGLSDLLHFGIDEEFVDRVLYRIHDFPNHQFVLLSKRWERLPDLFNEVGPPPNLAVGVSVWDQKSLDQAYPYLAECSAAVRFVNAEPLLGPIQMDLLTPRPNCQHKDPEDGCCSYRRHLTPECHVEACTLPDARRPIDGIMCGAEIGSGRRTCEKAWVRKLRDQADAAEIPFFLKRLSDGSRRLDRRTHNELPWDKIRASSDAVAGGRALSSPPVGKQRGGRLSHRTTY